MPLWWWWWFIQVLSDSLDLMNYSPPGSSVHGIFQAKILKWVAISSSRKSSWPRDQTHVSCIAGSLLHYRWILDQRSCQGILWYMLFMYKVVHNTENGLSLLLNIWMVQILVLWWKKNQMEEETVTLFSILVILLLIK